MNTLLAALSCFQYGEPVENLGHIPNETYKELVKSSVITCVDVFVYNTTSDAYLLIKRAGEPAKGTWWLPGGRVEKGESHKMTAGRKCREETGLQNVQIHGQLGPTYMTSFDKSAWGCSTQTSNTVFFATTDSDELPKLDDKHVEYRWVPIDEDPSDPYVKAVYDEALKYLPE